MWWGHCSTRRARPNNSYWVVGLIVFLIAVSATRSFMPFIPIFLLLFVILVGPTVAILTGFVGS